MEYNIGDIVECRKTNQLLRIIDIDNEIAFCDDGKYYIIYKDIKYILSNKYVDKILRYKRTAKNNMTNYEKIMAELQNMSIEEFAKERVIYDDCWGIYRGDFGTEDDRELAIQYEIEWLKQEVKNENRK